MRVAVIGSRSLQVDDLETYLPVGTTMLVSGGAKGIDACVGHYADMHSLRCLEFLPDYRRYGKAAPLKRNRQIIDSADYVIALWDGRSHGTRYTIGLCLRQGIPLRVCMVTSPQYVSPA